MKANKMIAMLFFLSFSLLMTVCAHPGKTDSNGGHYDKKTGQYHYHNNNNSSSNSNKSNYKDNYAYGVYISNMPTSMRVGETIKLEGQVQPANAKDKELFWETSDSTVASIDETGILKANSCGNVIITVRTSQGTNTKYFLTIDGENIENVEHKNTTDEISVYMNGRKIEFDVKPQIINGRTMVPIRAIFETMGAIVSWDGTTETAVCKKGEREVKMTVNKKTMYIDDEAIEMDVFPVVIDGRTLAPARYVAESFGADVGWSDKKKIVTLTTNHIPVYADYYNVPDVGKFFGVEVLDEYDYEDNKNVHVYVYDYDEIYKIAMDNPEYVNTLDNVMQIYGYQQIQQHRESYYFDSSILYGNLDNTDYVVRIVWRVLDAEDKEVTAVEVEPTKNIVDQQGLYRFIPITEIDLWEKEGWAVCE